MHKNQTKIFVFVRGKLCEIFGDCFANILKYSEIVHAVA